MPTPILIWEDFVIWDFQSEYEKQPFKYSKNK